MYSKTRIDEELDAAIRLSLEKFEARQRERIKNEFSSIPTTYTTASNGFSLHDFEETIKMIKELPPMATEMEVSPSGYISMFVSFKRSVDISQGYYPGIKIMVVQEDDELKENQTRIKYNDGTSKIIDIW